MKLGNWKLWTAAIPLAVGVGVYFLLGNLDSAHSNSSSAPVKAVNTDRNTKRRVWIPRGERTMINSNPRYDTAGAGVYHPKLRRPSSSALFPQKFPCRASTSTTISPS